MDKKRNVGILIFDNAEVLDFAGPFEVFSVTSELNQFEPFEVFTVGEQLGPINTINGLSVNPKYDFSNCPDIDILIIAGGFGTRKLIAQENNTLDWIKRTHQHTEFTVSICSGAMLLGRLGVLDGKPYCTHHQVYEDLKGLVPTGIPQEGQRFVKTGKIYTSAGISAGIDLSFHLVEQLLGAQTAERTAAYMEYDRK
jgi:transcriptional regulator GlxA family with amidase domain